MTRQTTQSRTADSDRKQANTRREQERFHVRQDWEGLSPAVALQALLAGVEAWKLPAEQTLRLSHLMGNSALLDALSQRETAGPRLTEYRLPAGAPADTAPLEVPAEAPMLADAPVFAGEMSTGAAMEY